MAELNNSYLSEAPNPIIMTDHRLADSRAVTDDENFQSQVLDEPYSDSDTIPISSPEFWEGVDQSNLGSNCLYEKKGAFEVESKQSDQTCILGAQLSYDQFKLLEESEQERYFENVTRAFYSSLIFENSCPRIDHLVLQHYDNNNRLTLAEQNEACFLRENIRRKWSLSNIFCTHPAPRRSPHRISEWIQWYDHELRWNPDNLQFEFEPPYDSRWRYPSLDVEFDRSIREHGFIYHISSPLLLYRLNILTGKLHDLQNDEYKVSWDMTFYHLDRVSTLRLWDGKGGARAVFGGLKETQDDALEFINFLTQFKFPHSYDGVISGTIA